MKYKRGKAITNGFDMDSGLDGWKKTSRKRHWGDHTSCPSLKNKRVTLRDGSTYSLEDYHREQKRGTSWVSSRTTSMRELATHLIRGPRATKKRPELVVKSYVLQEAEACSREAKLRACRHMKLRVTNMQHDGVMVHAQKSAAQWDETAALLTLASRAACGYDTVVEAALVPEWESVVISGAQVVT